MNDLAQEALIVSMARGGFYLKEIAKRVKKPKEQVIKIAAKHKVTIRKNKPVPKIGKEQIKHLIQLQAKDPFNMANKHLEEVGLFSE